ncbi:MAG: redoxin domain-containing protein [Deltaproteobacteria bacterium]|nr:redoxin domain-containing protein [Deltaproteobacteria bacterium]
MKTRNTIAVAAALLSSACAHGQQLDPGTSAPPFELAGSDGRQHALADHLGKEVVVLAWFPKAFTGG